MAPVRVRFAPSPTGYLHIGGLRTALFNYLFAKKNGGSFILRIEDTDRTRYVPDALTDIMASLRWLGIEWDEGPDTPGAFGPYTQSERLSLYREAAEELIASGHAYRCFCTAERLEEMRAAQKNETRYDGRCRDLPKEEAERLMAAGTPYVVRLAAPRSGTTLVRDFLRGDVAFENALQDDLVLLKGDGFPTYHLAHVVDDHAMEITHVLRGEEWLPSTPKHVLLFAAFGWTPPLYVHLPVILSPSGGKLSKRDGATNVREFIEMGYLPEAMTNFLALLGWSFDGERSMFTLPELEQEFVLEKIGMASPVFDRAKLDDYNGKYIRMAGDAELAARCRPYLIAAGLLPPAVPEGTQARELDDHALLLAIMPLYRERLVHIQDIVDQARFFFSDDIEYRGGDVFLTKKTTREEAAAILSGAESALGALAGFTHDGIESCLRALVDEISPRLAVPKNAVRQVFMTLRVALTGREVSPGLFEIMEVLGRGRCLSRIAAARLSVGKGDGGAP